MNHGFWDNTRRWIVSELLVLALRITPSAAERAQLAEAILPIIKRQLAWMESEHAEAELRRAMR